MNIAKFISNWWKDTLDHKQRVLKDGGALRREDATQEFFSKLREIGIYDSCVLAVSPDFGIKTRISGSNTFMSKAYSLKPNTSVTRRNLLTYTEEFDNAAWIKSNVTVLQDSTQSPDIRFNADFIADNNTLDRHRVLQSFTPTLGVTYCLSVYVKKSSAGKYLLLNANTALGARAALNLDTLEITNINGTGAFIKSYNNDWYLFGIYGVAITSSSIAIYIQIQNSPEDVTYIGDGSGFYIWGAQLEVGSSASAYQRVIDANSWDGVLNDATQTTSTSQPHLGNTIALNERPSFKNQNGQSNYLTHPTISFAANQEWTVHTVVTPFGSNAGVTSRLLGNDTASKTRIELASTGGTLFVYGETANGSIAMPNRKGKSTVLSLVYNGSGTVTAYIDGSSIGTIAVNSQFIFNTLFRASGGQNLFGTMGVLCIFSKAHTPTQIAQFANYLKVKYPEIPTVRIGNDYWATSNCEMVTTPMGNPIANVTDNTAWSNSTATYDSVYAATAGTVEQKTYAAVKAAGFWSFYNNDANLGAIYAKLYNWYAIYLLHKDLVYLAMTGANVVAQPYNSSKVYIVRINARTSGAGTVTLNATGRGYNNVITLSGTDTLYELYVNGADGVTPTLTYSGTGSMTVNEFSMYEDVWGYKVPTDILFTSLANSLGGAAVAGGKMKVGGTTYWNSPNTGGDNSSGFSYLPHGMRLDTGTFSVIGSEGHTWTITEVNATQAKRLLLASSGSGFDLSSGTNKIRGMALRLIKS